MPSYKFIINPVPLKNKHKVFLKEFGKKLTANKVKYSFEYTAKDKGAASIGKKAAGKYDVVVACGGDGTIMEVINGIYGSKSKLGIFPFGTSNDFAKHLGIKYGNCAEILFRGGFSRIDLGLAEFSLNDKKKKLMFCSTSGIGFDAKLLQLNKRRLFIISKKILGKLTYPFASFFLLFSYKSSQVNMEIGSVKISANLFMMNANFVRSMSGIKVTPNADVNNGIFDIIIFEDTNIFKKIFGFIWYSITSKKLDFKEISYISEDKSLNKYGLGNVKSFSVKSKKPVEIQLNGNFVGFTPANFNVLPRKLSLIK